MTRRTHRRPRTPLALAAAFLLGVAAATSSLAAEGGEGAPGTPGSGITVAGSGEAKGRPTVVHIAATVSGEAELAADAIVKYRDAKRRLQEAFAALKLDHVEVEERGLLVDEKGMQQSPYFFDYQPNRRTKAEVQLTRKLVVGCSNIRDMDEEDLLQLVAKLLDVAQDAGARVGTDQGRFNPYYYNPYERSRTGLVRFILDDFEKLEEEAYEGAIADARARAERLAKLSRVELGPITAVRVAAAPEEMGRQPDDGEPRKRLESSKFQEIPVRVDLLVRFDVCSGVVGPVTEGRAEGR